jgi:long-chain acyl-CoA synthetase
VLAQDGLQNQSLIQPDKTALVCGERRLTYAEVDDMANRLANALIAAGVERGDRVAVFLPNSLETVAAIFATLKAGAIFVVINHSTKFDKLSYILDDCQASALIAGAQAAAQGTVAKLRQAHECLKVAVVTGPGQPGSGALSFDSIQEEYRAERPRVDNIDLDLACLIYTSGSTGEPKAVMCDHGAVVFVTDSVIGYLENSPTDTILSVLPLSSGYGLYQVLMSFTFGGTLVLESSFAYPSVTMEKIARERVTGFPGVPTMFAALLQMDLARFDLSSLRYITNAAAALPTSHVEELARRLPNTKIFSMYGLTETKRALYLPPDQVSKRPGSVGIAIPGTEVWIEGPDGERLPPNQVGELVVRGRHVMRGYWRAPEATSKRFRPGLRPGERVCYTGDLFRMDNEGFMYFVGRKDDIINTRGEKVAPKEVENVLHRIPGVVEATVFGVPDPILGEALKAVIVADTSRVGKAGVLAYCRAHLEDCMVPKFLEFRDELPKTSSGKILKRALV